MYAGRIVEQAPVRALFDEPQHPYTVGLLGSIPRLDARARAAGRDRGPGARPAARCPAAAASPTRCPFARRAAAAPRRRRCARSAPGASVGVLARAARSGRAGAARCRWRRRCARMTAQPHRCCRLEGLVKHFPVRRGLFGRAQRRGARRRRRRLRARAGRDAGRGRRIAAAASRPLGRLVLRLIEPTAGTRRLRRAATSARSTPRALRAQRRAHADHLPGPVLARSTRA